MFKKIFIWITIIVSIYGFYRLYKLWDEYSMYKRYGEYVPKESAAENVTVLRDSILIEYQGQKRTVHVYLPPDYGLDSNKRYPVMYFMDGAAAFNDMENESPEWEVDEVINAAHAAGQATAIVFGIENAEERDNEYTPWITQDIPKAHGEEFGDWLTRDFKTWVDSNYLTMPGVIHTSIGGISRSGMMAYYLLMDHPDVFGKALIQSPSMWVDPDKLFAMDISKDQLANKQVFVCVGEKEGGPMIPHAEALYEKFKALGLGEDQLKYMLIEGEGHWHGAWRKSFAEVYPWLDWSFSK